MPKGVLPKLSRAGYTLAQAFHQGVLDHTPLLITLVRPLYTGENKNLGWLGGAQGARQTLQIFVWSRFDGEHGRRRRRKALSPSLSRFWGGVPLFVKCSRIFQTDTHLHISFNNQARRAQKDMHDRPRYGPSLFLTMGTIVDGDTVNLRVRRCCLRSSASLSHVVCYSILIPRQNPLNNRSTS